MNFDKNITNNIAKVAIPLTGQSSDYKKILDHIADAQLVLLGEATHGTDEFYRIRVEISKYLITQKDFNVIAVEGDWPDAYQINRFIHGEHFTKATEALASFDRFPTWMWRNVPILELTEWLYDYNKTKDEQHRASFYGLDLYSLYRSIDAIISTLEKIDPAIAQEAKYHYSCFENLNRDPERYSRSVYFGRIKSCEPEVIEALKRLQTQTWDMISEGKITPEKAFYITQNARVVKNAEKYYRSLFLSDVINWNLRDSHMMETAQEIIKHYQLKGIKTPKLIIWAHNSHVGNAAATQMAQYGEYNIGQLAKEKFGKKAYSLGFTTYNGTVSAASNWHSHVERKNIRNALPESYEHLFHQVGIQKFFLPLKESDIPDTLLERAIGVVYVPQTERQSHYFYASLAQQFDSIIHCDKTHAVEPLEKTSIWIEGEAPETYPSGL